MTGSLELVLSTGMVSYFVFETAHFKHSPQVKQKHGRQKVSEKTLRTTQILTLTLSLVSVKQKTKQSRTAGMGF